MKLDNKMTIKNLSVNYFFDFKNSIGDKKAAMKELVRDVERKNHDYLGFKNKNKLSDFLQREIYGFSSGDFLVKKTIGRERINSIIKRSILICREFSNSRDKLIINVFPSYNKFINSKMSGVSGYTSDKKNILIFISPQKNWQMALKNSLVHEFAHTKAFKYHQWQTLLESLIFEGLADNFREQMIGGKPAAWSVALNQTAAKKTFLRLKKLLNSKSEDIYSQVFLGYGRRYPLWSGYAIGYRIVKAYLKANKDKSWGEIFKLRPQEIFKQSIYLK